MRAFLSSHFRVTKPFLLWRVSTSSVHTAPSGENHALLYFHCLLSVSLHTESQTLLIWTKWIWKNRKMLFLKIFSSYLIPNLCFSKTKNNVANSQPIRKNQPQMSSLFDMWIIFLHRFTLKKIFLIVAKTLKSGFLVFTRNLKNWDSEDTYSCITKKLCWVRVAHLSRNSASLVHVL